MDFSEFCPKFIYSFIAAQLPNNNNNNPRWKTFSFNLAFLVVVVTSRFERKLKQKRFCLERSDRVKKIDSRDVRQGQEVRQIWPEVWQRRMEKKPPQWIVRWWSFKKRRKGNSTFIITISLRLTTFFSLLFFSAFKHFFIIISLNLGITRKKC